MQDPGEIVEIFCVSMRKQKLLITDLVPFLNNVSFFLRGLCDIFNSILLGDQILRLLKVLVYLCIKLTATKRKIKTSVL